jgi:GMP synthase (glutamine-hydrolysing)
MIEEGRIIEPIKDLYKEEVRDLGRALGIEDELLLRHPFPGPGLGIRLLCAREEPPEYRPEILNPRLNTLSVEKRLSAALLPVKSVGVKGDVRSYELPVLLTGEEVAWEDILYIAGRIPGEIKGINRCVYNLNKEPVVSVELVPSMVSRSRLDLLREADAAVMKGLEDYGLLKKIWQCPTVLLPLSLNGKGKEFVVIRPVHSQRAMTATPAPLPQGLINEILGKVLSLPDISGVGIDVSTKPPGTIEWE